MTATIGDIEISSVAVIDDDPRARESYKIVIEDMDSAPVLEEGPLAEIDEFVELICGKVSAAFCDFHLKKHDYATFNGDLLASRLYSEQVPVVLCTAYTDWEVSILRTFRRNIPRVISYDDAEPDTIMQVFEACVAEFRGKFHDTRRPWRSLVRIDEIDEEGQYTYVVVPGWSAQKRIRIQNTSFPPLILEKLRGGRERLHAQVNLGAEADEELYLTDWEV